MVSAWLSFLLLLTCARLLELRLSKRNAARARARGAVEYGAGQLIWMKLLHGAFLIGCAAEVILLQRPLIPGLAAVMLGLVSATHALRYWTIHTLGERWCVLILVEPGRPAATGGPFRFLRHPNYLAVIVEGVAIPLVHTAWITAIAFTLLNMVLLLGFRIPAEERALAEHCGYAEHFARRERT